MPQHPSAFFLTLWHQATSVLRITGAGGRKWKRNVQKGARIGPWLEAEYLVLDERVWTRRCHCLYFVVARADGRLRYVGKSKKQVSERWRMSPALCAETGVLLENRQLFHSQCMRPMQDEFARQPSAVFDVRTLSAQELRPLAAAAGWADVCAIADDGDFVEKLEGRMCAAWSPTFASWNQQGTQRSRRLA